MLQQYLPNGIGVLGAIFLFGFAIFIHELGHFLVAKWAGVGVQRFALGFGPVIVAITRGGTEYSIRWLPVGGFVQLKGAIEEDEPAPAEEKRTESGEPLAADAPGAAGEAEPAAGTQAPEAKRQKATEDLDALRNRHPLVRIAVYVAGVTCNYLTAIVLMAVLLIYGLPRPAELPNVVENIPENSKWYELGWRSGDRVVAVGRAPVTALGPVLSNPATGVIAPLGNSGPIRSWNELEEVLASQIPQESRFATWRWLKGLLGLATPKGYEPTLEATVERDGRRLELPLPAALLADPVERGRFSAPLPAYIGAILPASPADRARLVKMDYTPGERIVPTPNWEEMRPTPLRPGDTVLAVNGESVATWSEMTQLLYAQPGKSVDLTVRRTIDGAPHVQLLETTLETDPENPQRGQLGVLAGVPPSDGTRERKPILRAIAEAPVRTLMLTDQLVAGTAKFLATHSGREIKRNLGGPAAIVKMAYESAQRGLGDYLWMFIIISITLAVMNLLPVPVLDGGYVMITIVEAIIRRPIPQRVLVPILTIFTVLLILTFVLLMNNDFQNIVLKY